VQPDFALRALSYGVIGLLLITALALSLVSIRKEERYDEPLDGLFLSTLVVVGLCTFVALCSASQAARPIEKISPRMQTETVKVQ